MLVADQQTIGRLTPTATGHQCLYVAGVGCEAHAEDDRILDAQIFGKQGLRFFELAGDTELVGGRHHYAVLSDRVHNRLFILCGWFREAQIVVGSQIDAIVTIVGQLECSIVVVGHPMDHPNNAARVAADRLVEDVLHPTIDVLVEEALPILVQRCVALVSICC